MTTVGTALLVQPGAAAAGSEAAAGRVMVAVVERAAGSRVTARIEDSGQTVTLPASGFPQGWTFRRGDRVAVVASGHGAGTIGPLVVPASGSARVRGDEATIGDVTAEVDNAAVRDALADSSGDGEGVEGLLVENAVTDEARWFGVMDR